jgi:hypothetical protein
MSWPYMCQSMHKGCLLIGITLSLVYSPKDHYCQCPGVTVNFAQEFLTCHWQSIMFPTRHQHSFISSNFWNIPHYPTMLELCSPYSVTDPSVGGLEHSFFEQEIQLPLVAHPFFFASKVHLNMLTINWPQGRTSINPS